MSTNFSRRSFIKTSAVSGAMFGLLGFGCKPEEKLDAQEILERAGRDVPGKGKSVMGLKVPPIKQVRVGIIGLGARGSGMTRNVNALCPDKAKIVAICDIQQNKLDRTLNFLKKEGQNPATYTGSEDSWKELVARDDIDLVMIFTHWELHTPIAVEAMKKGKHVAT